MMSKPRRLHPISIAIRTVSAFYHYIIPIGILILFRARNLEAESFTWLFVVAVIFLTILVIRTILYWYRYTYYVKNEEFYIEYGIWFKKMHVIPLERIHSINKFEGVLHRLFNVAKLRVETAANIDSEVELDAISDKEAETLWAILTKNRETTNIDSVKKDKETTEPHRSLTAKEFIILSITSGSIGIILPIIGSGISFLDNFIHFESFVQSAIDLFRTEADFLLITVVFCVAIIIALIASIIAHALKYARFRVSRNIDHLIIQYGLFENHSTILPVSRIQAIRIEEGVFRQPFGFATLRAICLGGGTTDDNHSALHTVFPLLRMEEVNAFLRDFLPEYTLESATYSRAPKRAWRHFLILDMLISSVVSLILVCLFYPWGALALFLIPLSLFYNDLRYKDQRWHLTGDKLIVRSRLFRRSTVITTSRRIQSSKLKQTPFQQKNHLMTYEFDIAGGWLGYNFEMEHIDKEDAEHLLKWLKSTKCK